MLQPPCDIVTGVSKRRAEGVREVYPTMIHLVQAVQSNGHQATATILGRIMGNKPAGERLVAALLNNSAPIICKTHKHDRRGRVATEGARMSSFEKGVHPIIHTLCIYAHYVNSALIHLLTIRGLLKPNARPLTVRNVLAFFVRLLGTETPWMEGCQPMQTSDVMNRYDANPKPRTLIAARAHHRWLRSLLQVCNIDVTKTIPTTTTSFNRHPYFKQHSFTADEVQRLYHAADDTYTHLVLQILFTTGLRVGGLSRIPLPTTEGDPVVITETDDHCYSDHLLAREGRCPLSCFFSPVCVEQHTTMVDFKAPSSSSAVIPISISSQYTASRIYIHIEAFVSSFMQKSRCDWSACTYSHHEAHSSRRHASCGVQDDRHCDLSWSHQPTDHLLCVQPSQL